MQVAADLAQPDGQLAELRRRASSSGASPRSGSSARSAAAASDAAPSPSSGATAAVRRSGALGELGSVAHAVPLGAQSFLLPALEPVGALDELAQRFERAAAAPASRAISSLCLRAAAERPPGSRGLRRRSACSLADEGVEHVELIRRAAPAAAARTGPTSRSAARSPPRDPRGRPRGPRRRPACARRRRRAGRGRDPARLPGAAPRAIEPGRRRTRPGTSSSAST